MTIASEIVSGALNKIRVNASNQPAEDEDIDSTFKRLRVILFEYEKQGYVFGLTIPTLVADEVAEPDDITDKLESILAVRVAPVFGVDPDPFVLQEKQDADEYFLRYYMPANREVELAYPIVNAEIRRAIKNISVFSDQMNAVSQTALDDVFYEYQSLLAEYQTRGYTLGITQPTTIADDTGATADVREHLANILALQISYLFKVDPSNQLRADVAFSENYLHRHFKPLNCEDIPRHSSLPLGQGNYTSGYSQIYWSGDGSDDSGTTVVEVERLFISSSAEFSISDGNVLVITNTVMDGQDIQSTTTDLILARNKRYEIDISLTHVGAGYAGIDIQQGDNGVYSPLNGGNIVYVGNDAGYVPSINTTRLFDVASGDNQVRLLKSQSVGAGVVTGTLTIKSIATI